MAIIRILDGARPGEDTCGDRWLRSSFLRRRSRGLAAVAFLWLSMGAETAWAQYNLQPLPANYDST
jgi:hypothetical protein